MQFVFNDRKTAQMAAWFLARHGGRMPYIKLIKLMYLADRQSLVESGYPITGDKLVSMDHGPVLSRVLNLITWGKLGPHQNVNSSWGEYVSAPDGWDVTLLRALDDEITELSEYEIGVLEDVFTKFGHWDKWRLRDYTHELPEWENPSGTSIAIDVRVILEEAGMSDEEIREIASQADAIRDFKSSYAAR